MKKSMGYSPDHQFDLDLQRRNFGKRILHNFIGDSEDLFSHTGASVEFYSILRH